MRRLRGLHLLALLMIAAMVAAPAYANGARTDTSAQATMAAIMGGTQASMGSGTGGGVMIAKGKTIKLGWAGDESLQLVVPSQGILYGAKVAVNRRNAAGGIKGFKVEIADLDDQCKGDAATTVAQKFASDPEIVGIVGHVCSGATIAAADVYEKARIVMVSGSVTADALTNKGLTVFNRVVLNDGVQGVADAQFMYNELKAKKLAVLDDNQLYGQGLANTVKTNFTKLGGTVTDAESIDPAAKDYRPILTKLLADPPDVLFFGGYEGPGALLTQQMKEVGLTNTKFFSDDGVQTSTYLNLAGKDAEGAYASALASKSDDAAALKSFSDEFAKTFNVDYAKYDPYQPNGFDAANVLMNAIEKVATVDAKGDLNIDREALIKAVRATSIFKGLTGTLTCDSTGNCGAGAATVAQAQGGKWVPLKTYTLADLGLGGSAPAAGATMAATKSAGSMATMSATMAATASK